MESQAGSIFSFAAKASIENINTVEFAAYMDDRDDLKDFRDEFCFPAVVEGKSPIYLCGNSLGLQPKGLKASVVKQLDKWAVEGVEGHFEGTV